MYQPKFPPFNADLKGLTEYVKDEFQSVAQAAYDINAHIPMAYLAVAPTRPRNGLYFSAAGVLGASRGAYRYDESTGLYTFLA